MPAFQFGNAREREKLAKRVSHRLTESFLWYISFYILILDKKYGTEDDNSVYLREEEIYAYF